MRFFIISSIFGFVDDTNESHSNAIGDVNNDGLLDIIVTNRGNQNVDLWMNNTETTNNWLKVKLNGVQSNKDGIGSIIEISVNGKIQYRYTLCGEGYLAQNSSTEVFGLGSNSTINYLKVKWLSGIEDYFFDIEANQLLTIIEGTGTTNNQIFGCTNTEACNYNPNANVDDGSCIFSSAVTISGNQNSSPFTMETYTCNPAENENVVFDWNIINGEILNGQGSNTIQVKWDFVDEGKITVVEHNGTCSSEVNQLIVAINVNNVSENISVARLWNEALLEAIRNDYARPTVHARNLFHTAIALYDAWAIYDSSAKPYFMGNTVNNYKSELSVFTPQETIEASKEKAMNYAAYRFTNPSF